MRARTNARWPAYQPPGFSTAAADELTVHPWALTPALDDWQADHPDEGILGIVPRREMIAGLVLLGAQLCGRGAAIGAQPWSIPITSDWIAAVWPAPSDQAFVRQQRLRLRGAGVLSALDDDTDVLSETWFCLLPGLPAVDWAALRGDLGLAARGARAEADPVLLVARLLAYLAAMRALSPNTDATAAPELPIEHAQVGAWCGINRHRVGAALATLAQHGRLERRRQHGKAERVVLRGQWWNGDAPPGFAPPSLHDAHLSGASTTPIPEAIAALGGRAAAIPPELLALVVAGTLVVDFDMAAGRLTFRKA